MTQDSEQDRFFSEDIKQISDFKFGQDVVNVFDDMVNRSVPFYEEMQRMLAEQAGTFAQKDTVVYDLGCSTGTSMFYMDKTIDQSIPFVGLDNSQEMLNKCRARLEKLGVTREIILEEKDLNNKLEISNASVVVSCLTLQFVRPIYRKAVLKKIRKGIVGGGVFILIEKILAEESNFNRFFIDYYYNMKRRHNYSELEISQKREALENVLIPYKLSENLKMLEKAGFDHAEVFFKWYNFCGIIAEIKP